MKNLVLILTTVLLLFIGACTGFVVTHQTHYVLPQMHHCTSDEMFFSPNSPTFFQAGKSLLSAGKYICNSN